MEQRLKRSLARAQIVHVYTTLEYGKTVALDEEDPCLDDCLLLFVLENSHFIFLNLSLQSVNDITKVAVRDK